jgi:hypothetical protein
MTVPDLEPDQLAAVEQFRTCEFATLSRSGVPIAWPLSPLRRPDGTVVLTTSIGLPQKAFNVRRDPRVALLFSDPTGSGLEDAPEVLVQGMATCPDKVAAGPEGVEKLWRRLYQRQPASKAYSANAVSRWFMDFYYMRLHIIVTPTAVTSRPALRPTVSATAGPLAGFPSAVLGVRDDDGMPRLLRVGVAAAGDSGPVTLQVPDGAEIQPGPASLLAHSHDEKLWNLQSVVLLGELTKAGGTWTFTPNRVIGGSYDNPIALLRSLVAMRRTASRYLAKRNLPRPRVAWDEFAVLASGTGQGSQPTRPDNAA